jgi:hypothetical protein
MSDEKATVLLTEEQKLAYVDALRTARSELRFHLDEWDTIPFATVIEKPGFTGMSDPRVVKYILTGINSQIHNKADAEKFYQEDWPYLSSLTFSEKDIQEQERFLTSKRFDINYLRRAVVNPKILEAAKPEYETATLPRVDDSTPEERQEGLEPTIRLIGFLEKSTPRTSEKKPLPGKISESLTPEEESHHIRNALIVLTTMGTFATLLGLDGGLNDWGVSKSLFATPAGNFHGVDVPSGVWIGVCALAAFVVAAWCKSRIPHQDPPALESESRLENQLNAVGEYK